MAGNLQVVRESVARFSAGDIEGLARCYAPDVVVVSPEGWPEAASRCDSSAPFGSKTA